MSDEARKEQKVKAKALKVKYKSATLEDFIEQYAKDISRTGMWKKAPKPPAQETICPLASMLSLRNGIGPEVTTSSASSTIEVGQSRG